MPQVYMVIERFRNDDAVPVYRRYRECGRMAPPGLVYLSSWVDESFTRCFQVMETSDRSLLDAWMKNWDDIVEFEVVPVIASDDAADRIAPLLQRQ